MNTDKQITDFLKYLSVRGISQKSLKYYKSDLNSFLSWAGTRKVNTALIREYINSVKLTTPLSTLNRRLSTLRSYSNFIGKDFMTGIENQTNVRKVLRTWQDSIMARFENKPRIKNLMNKVFFNRPKWYTAYHSLAVSNYIHIAILILFTSISGYAVYDQVFNITNNTFAFPAALTRPNRFLSFQGRLTDNLGNPKTVATNMVFKLYSVSTGGSELWSSGTCSITPDQDGIFSTLLGSSCGAEIAATVFSENAAIWLGATMGADTEATPRVQIATVAYALNAETLQGFPAGTGTSTIPYINSAGSLVLANASPKIQSTSGTFAVEGLAMSLTTPNASDGVITIAPDGVGTVDLTFEGTAPGLTQNGFVNATNANITSGSLYSGTVASNATGYNFINFLSGSSPTSKFSVDSTGLTTVGADLYVNSGISTFGNAVTDDTIEATKFCTGDGETNCVTDFSALAGGGFTSFTAAGDSGGGQAITNSNTLSILGGTNGIDTIDSATDTVTINLDTTEIGTTTFGIGSATTWTFDASAGTDTTLAFGDNLMTLTAATTALSGDLKLTGADILDTNGNEFLRFTSTASAVDELTIANAAANGIVTVAATGGDTNIALSIDSKGSDALNLNGTATGDVVIAGGSASTGCTITNSTGNLACSGDLTVTGDDLFMNTNTSGSMLVADGTNFNPVAMSGDIAIDGTGATAIGANKVTESMLKAVDTAADEECLTYEATVGDFEWQTCGGSGSWSSLSAPSANLSLAMSTYTTGFNWATGTGTSDLFSLTTDASANGTGSLLNLQTGAGATVLPLRVRSGAIEGLTVDASGNVGVGLTNPIAKLQVKTSATTTTGKSALIIDQYENQDIFTASASGVTKLTLKSDGTLELANATSNISNTAGDITIDAASGIISFSADDISNIGTVTAGTGIFTSKLQVAGASALTYSRLGTNTTGHGLSAGDDLLVSSDIELDGNLYLDGGIIANTAGTASLVLSSTPTTTSNNLTAGNWLVENTANVGQAALMVNNLKSGDLFTASSSGTTKFTVHNDGSITLASNIASSTNAIEGTIYYDNNSVGSSATDQLYMYGSDSAWHRLAVDMTKYSATNAAVSNQSYIEIAHNQNTNDMNLTGWVYDTVTSLWKKISDYSHDVTQALQSQFNDAANKMFAINTNDTLMNNFVAYWAMDEASATVGTQVTRSDSYGANNLTDNRSGTSYILSGTGKVNNAADLELSNGNFFELADNNDLSTGDIDFTVSAWINMESESATTTPEIILGKSDSASVREYALYYTGATADRLQFELYNSSGTSVCTATANTFGAVTTATWYHILAWHDATANTCNISINNGTADSAAESGVASDTAANFRIGARTSTETDFFDGLIDEVGFWKKTLTAQEKTDLYNSGNGNSYATKNNLVRTESTATNVQLTPAINVGTGADGAITHSAGTTVSLNTSNLISGRSCADGGDAVNYSVTALTSTTATLESTPSTGCLKAGDEVLLINLKGAPSAYINVGNYETLTILSISSATVTFTTSKTKYYGTGATDDAGISLSDGGQAVMLQRVPNYTDVTVSNASSILTSDAWVAPAGSVGNQGEGGVLFFRATGTVSVGASALIDVQGKGFIAGAGGTTGGGGEAYCGVGGTASGGAGTCGGGAGGSASAGAGGSGSATGGAGGGGGRSNYGYTTYGGGGGGGGYGTGGGLGGGANNGVAGGTGTSGNGGTAATAGGGGGGGGTYGNTSLTTLFFGSAGGGGNQGYNNTTLQNGGAGGNGGGIIYISSNTLSVAGNIRASGSNGTGGSSVGSGGGSGGGGGAGGSVKLLGNNLTLGSSLVLAAGGAGGSPSGTTAGAGGNGRIAVQYSNTTSGTASPAAETTLSGYNSYGLYHSPVIGTPNAVDLEAIRWNTPVIPYSKVSVQTRTGATSSPTDGTWEPWRPFTVTTNYLSLNDANTHGDWTGTNLTVADGDVTRDVNQFEDEDEATVGNLTKFTSSTSGGTAEVTTLSPSKDLSTYDYVTFWIRASQTGSSVKFGIGEGAATEQEETINIDTADTWQKVYWDLSDIQPGLRDAITKMRFTNLIASSNTIYIDNIRAEKLLTNHEHSIITSTPNNYFQYRVILSTTNTAYQPQVENITFTYNDGFKIVQTDANTVRLYNYSGDTQQIRLDAIVFGADLAEWYTVIDPTISAGDLVSLTGDKDEFGVPVLGKSNGINDSNLVGVVSTKAGQTLGIEAENRRLLGLAGRVPVKISPNSPDIKPGDTLTSSDVPGLATLAMAGDKTIGKATESWTKESGKNSLLIIIDNSYAPNPTTLLSRVYRYMFDTKEIIDETTQRVVKEIGVFAMLITPELKTNVISPVANADLIIDLQPDDAQSVSKLAIKGIDNEIVASIDATGKVESNSLEVSTDATISGTLYADKIESSRLTAIENLLAEVEGNQQLFLESQTWNTDTATESATISDVLANNLFVTGNATVTSLFVAENLTAKSLDSIDGTLSIQSLAIAPVEIMAGKIKIDVNGDAFFSGNVEVAGNLKLDGNIVIANGIDPIATESAEIVEGQTNSNATAGKATLTAGLNELRIVNSKVKENSLIYVTPVSSTQNKVLFVKTKAAGEFTIGFNEAIDTDVEFNWWIIELESSL